ncbi:MAG: histidine phosphatase family protein [Opitutaceae bacterium]|nr:histidine phosphatase family protein [Opitutaceae bacterium]
MKTAQGVHLYLIRHAHAEDGFDDATRPLSARGRKQIRTMARFLRRTGDFAPVEVWHSPLLRARDTATLLVGRLKLPMKLRTVVGLSWGDDPAIMATKLRARRGSLALVGHEPHLSALASLLVTGSAAPPVVVMRKCAVLALERESGRWVMRWLVSPDQLK